VGGGASEYLACSNNRPTLYVSSLFGRSHTPQTCHYCRLSDTADIHRLTLRQIETIAGVPSSTCHSIFRHTVTRAIEKKEENDCGGEELTVPDLVASDCLDPIQRPGATPKLSEAEKVHLAASVRRGYDTRRMKLVDIRREAGLNHVCDTTVLRALKEMGIKPYREEFEFILTQENMAIRKVGVEIPTKEKN